MNFISDRNDDDTFKYLEPMINCLMYFGFDGINYNWEDSGYSDDDIVEFHKGLYASAKKHGFDDFHCGIYTSSSGLSAYEADALFGNSEGRTHDLMLNYSNGDFSYQLSSSAKQAINAMGTTEGLYTGVWIVSLNRGWNRLNADEYAKQVSLCMWGEHVQSRFWSYNNGTDAYDAQTNYQYLLERFMSATCLSRHTSISATATAMHTRERRLQVHGTTCLTRTTFRHTVGSLLSRAH